MNGASTIAGYFLDTRIKGEDSHCLAKRSKSLGSFGGGKQKCGKPIVLNSLSLFRQQEVRRKAKYLI